MDFESGTTFGRYTIERAIGQGGMGRVYLARDKILERNVALKIVRPDRDLDEETSARFMREAKLAARLAHPNTVHIYDLGEIDGVPFIAMEHVEGKTLFGYVGDKSVPVPKRLRWLLDVARGLAAAHGCGLLHRDVKPTNVIVSSDGVAKILDFGLAKKIETTPEMRATFQTTFGFVVGTPAYMAPEQLEEKEVDARADQFSWAITAMMLLTGQNPRANDPLLLSPIPSLAGRVPGISKTTAEVFARAIAIDREARFGSMAELVNALDGALTDDFLRAQSPVATTEAKITVALGRGTQRLDITGQMPSIEPPTTQPLIADAPPPSVKPGPSPIASDAPSPPMAQRPTLPSIEDGVPSALPSTASPASLGSLPLPILPPAPPASPLGTTTLIAGQAPPPPANGHASPLARTSVEPSSHPSPAAISTLPMGEENPFARAVAPWLGAPSLRTVLEGPRETNEERRAQRWELVKKALPCPSAPLVGAAFSIDGRRVAGLGAQGLTLHDGGAWYGGPKPIGVPPNKLTCAAFLPHHRIAIGGDGVIGFTERDGTWSLRRGLPGGTRLHAVAYSPKPGELLFVGELADGGVVVRLPLDGTAHTVLKTKHPLTTVLAAPVALAGGPRGIVCIDDNKLTPLADAGEDAFTAMAIIDEHNAFVASEEKALTIWRTSQPTVIKVELPDGTKPRLVAVDEHRDLWVLTPAGRVKRRIDNEWIAVGSLELDSGDVPLAFIATSKRIRVVTTSGALFEGRRDA